MANPEVLDEVAASMLQHAPRLRLNAQPESLTAAGVYELVHEGQPLERYELFFKFGADPHEPPMVWEVGGKLPITKDRHVNTENGSCCIEVYGDWSTRTGDHSLGGFLAGPLKHYFLSQLHFERHGSWPFDERPHGLPGMVEAYAEILGVAQDARVIKRTLDLLAARDWKGHWICPCGSGARLRNCCYRRLELLRAKVDCDNAMRLSRYLREAILKSSSSRVQQPAEHESVDG